MEREELKKRIIEIIERMEREDLLAYLYAHLVDIMGQPVVTPDS